MIRCKVQGCTFKTSGQLGWHFLANHLRDIHHVACNYGAIMARGTCDDRDTATPADRPNTPPPGAALTDPTRY